MNSLAEIRNIRVTAEKDPEPKTANIVKIDLTPNRLPNPNALITGTFLQLDYTNTRDQEGSWKDELKAMKMQGWIFNRTAYSALPSGVQRHG